MRLINDVRSANGDKPLRCTVSVRYFRFWEYVEKEIGRILATSKKLAAVTKLKLLEDVPPMSLFLGVIRVAFDSVPAIDILHDTTDSELAHPAFATVIYQRDLVPFLEFMDEDDSTFGKLVQAFP
jgi:hypothetical protein